MNVVKRFLNQGIFDVPVVSATTPLPTGSMCFVPGAYLFNGVGYQCDQPGAYRFLDTANPVVQQRVMWNGDLYGLLSGLSCCHVHGVADEVYAGDWQTLSNHCRTRKMRLRCGHIVSFAMWLLPQVGFTVRSRNVIANPPLNGYDDGHIVLEVQVLGEWRMWDLTNGRYFTDAEGTHLSTEQVVSAGIANCQQVKIDGDLKINTEMAGGLDMGIYADMVLRTEADRAAWDERIFANVIA